MPSAYILSINDDLISPALELIRNICEPGSKSRPHVTVRYPIDRLQSNDLYIYDSTELDSIEIVGPGAFGLEGVSQHTKCTVFITCDSDELESLSYKPDYPDSVFHITLYDGYERSFATKLLAVLESFRWRFVLPLSSGTKLTKIEIGGNKRSSSSLDRTYAPRVRALFRDIKGFELTLDIIHSLGEHEKLSLVEKICVYLEDIYSNLPRVSAKEPWLNPSPGVNPSTAQLALFDPPGQPLLDVEKYISSTRKKFAGHSEPKLAHKNGLYLTPPELAFDIATFVYEQSTSGQIDFGDPAVGNGVFFAALRRVVPAEKLDSALGVELDSSRARSTYYRWGRRGLDVVQGDFLRLDGLPQRNLVIANPPYVRYQYISASDRNEWGERLGADLGIHVSGQSGLYVYFLLASHKWMASGGIAAWLLPSEFLHTKYGSAIRKYLTEKVQLIRVHQYSANDAQFENALVTSCVLVFRKETPKDNETVVLSHSGSLSKPLYKEDKTVIDLRRADKWSIPSIHLIARANLSVSLSDLFEIKRGIATGGNKYFILERELADKLGLPPSELRPILPKAVKLPSDIILSEDDGYPAISPQLSLIDSSLPLEQIKEVFPAFADYLESAGSEIRSSTLVARRRPWYRQEQRQVARFLCTYMARSKAGEFRKRFLLNYSEALATNTYHMLYPRSQLQRTLDEDPGKYLQMLRTLQSIDEDVFASSGRTYGGGLHKIEPTELKSMSLDIHLAWMQDVVLQIRESVWDA